MEEKISKIIQSIPEDTVSHVLAFLPWSEGSFLKLVLNSTHESVQHGALRTIIDSPWIAPDVGYTLVNIVLSKSNLKLSNSALEGLITYRSNDCLVDVVLNTTDTDVRDKIIRYFELMNNQEAFDLLIRIQSNTLDSNLYKQVFDSACDISTHLELQVEEVSSEDDEEGLMYIEDDYYRLVTAKQIVKDRVFSRMEEVILYSFDEELANQALNLLLEYATDERDTLEQLAIVYDTLEPDHHLRVWRSIVDPRNDNTITALVVLVCRSTDHVIRSNALNELLTFDLTQYLVESLIHISTNADRRQRHSAIQYLLSNSGSEFVIRYLAEIVTPHDIELQQEVLNILRDANNQAIALRSLARLAIISNHQTIWHTVLNIIENNLSEHAVLALADILISYENDYNAASNEWTQFLQRIEAVLFLLPIELSMRGIVHIINRSINYKLRKRALKFLNESSRDMDVELWETLILSLEQERRKTTMLEQVRAFKYDIYAELVYRCKLRDITVDFKRLSDSCLIRLFEYAPEAIRAFDSRGTPEVYNMDDDVSDEPYEFSSREDDGDFSDLF